MMALPSPSHVKAVSFGRSIPKEEPPLEHFNPTSTLFNQARACIAEMRQGVVNDVPF